VTTQHALGAVFSGELDTFDRVLDLLETLRERVTTSEWPIEMVFGPDDGVTQTTGFIFSHKTDLLTQMDEQIAVIKEMAHFYAQMLAALP
jgi:hypothetical protein